MSKPKHSYWSAGTGITSDDIRRIAQKLQGPVRLPPVLRDDDPLVPSVSDSVAARDRDPASTLHFRLTDFHQPSRQRFEHFFRDFDGQPEIYEAEADDEDPIDPELLF